MPTIITCIDDFNFETLCLVPVCDENAEIFFITNADNRFVYIRTPPMVYSGRYFTLRESDLSATAFLEVIDALDEQLLSLKDVDMIVSMMSRRSSGDWRCQFALPEDVTVFDVDGETTTNFEKNQSYILLVSPTQLQRCKQGYFVHMDAVQGMRVDLEKEKQKQESAATPQQPQHVDTHTNLLSDEPCESRESRESRE